MKISVLTTSYNYEKYIAQTIESVLNQTFQDFEYIILDDGSQDNSVQIIKNFAQQDNRIKFYTHPNNKNKGLIETLKKGIELCQGEYIVFVESDDLIKPDYIEKKLNILKLHPNTDIIFNNLNLIGDKSRIDKFQKYFFNQNKLLHISQFYISRLIYINIIPTFSCVMLKKSILQNTDFNFIIANSFDWYLWNTLLSQYNTVYLNEKLTTFRLHNQSYTCNKSENHLRYELIKCLLNTKEHYFLDNIFLNFVKNKKIEKFFRFIIKFITYIYLDKIRLKKTIKILSI